MRLHPRTTGLAACAVTCVLLGAGCSATSGGTGADPTPTASATTAAASRSGAAPTPAVAAPAAAASSEPKLRINDGNLPFDEPVRIAVRGATMLSSSVTRDDGIELAGAPTGDHQWTSTTTPTPGAKYRVTATVAGDDGNRRNLTGSFRVAPVPDSRRLTLAMQPTQGEIVGVGAPVAIRFDQHVTRPKDVERALTVSSAPRVTGTWYWIGDREVHFRPRDPWPAGTRVQVALDLNGVQAGKNLWGGRSYALNFTVGTRRTTVVDAKKFTFTVWENGRRKAVWPTSLGQPGFETRNGTYIVLEKRPTANMTSCGLGLTCARSDPRYYDLNVKWNVRLTNSGAFVHSAPWSQASQGSANVSHGCLNLSDARGRTFYDMSRYGDLVRVAGTPRNAHDLLANGDPGMADWNRTWTQYVQASALDKAIRTRLLSDRA